MKIIIASFLILFFGISAKAQLFYAQGGVNFANITTTNDGHTEKNNSLTSFNTGFMGRQSTTFIRPLFLICLHG